LWRTEQNALNQQYSFLSSPQIPRAPLAFSAGLGLSLTPSPLRTQMTVNGWMY
jgi:hypothetical protein